MADWSWLPRIAASDVGTLTRQYSGPYAMGDSGTPTPETEEYQGILDPGKYGLPTDAFNNFMRMNNNSGELDYLYKSGDKEGTQIRYTRDGDYYVPQVMGTQGWDTNGGAMQHLMPLALMGGMMAMPFIGGAAGASAAGNVGAGGGGAGLFDGAALGGFGGVEPIATSGFTAAQGGIGSFGGGFGLPGGVVAGEAGSGVLGLSNMAGSSIFDGSVGDLIKKFAPDLIKGGVNLVGGRIGDRQARINDEQFRDTQIGAARGLFDAAGEYSRGLTGLADQYKGAYDPFYAQVNNGVATSQIDPVTGKVGFQLNAPYQGQRDALFGKAGDVMTQIGSADPRAFATERYNAAQALLAPGDQLSQQNLMQDLFSKGGFGLTLNQPAAPGAAPGGGVTPGAGTVGVNPYVDTFLNATNRRNAGMSYDSLREGESYLDNLIRRQQGLFGAGQAIDTAGYGAARDAFDASNQFMGDRRRAAEFGYGAGREALSIPYQAQRDYIGAVSGANQGFQSRQAVADQTKQNSYWDTASKLPWGDIWSKVSGLFG